MRETLASKYIADGGAASVNLLNGVTAYLLLSFYQDGITTVINYDLSEQCSIVYAGTRLAHEARTVQPRAQTAVAVAYVKGGQRGTDYVALHMP